MALTQPRRRVAASGLAERVPRRPRGWRPTPGSSRRLELGGELERLLRLPAEGGRIRAELLEQGQVGGGDGLAERLPELRGRGACAWDARSRAVSGRPRHQSACDCQARAMTS